MRLNDLKLLIAILITAFLGMGFIAKSPPHECYREIVHTVHAGDTLYDIGYMYIDKNTYAEAYILAFIEGIREKNPTLTAYGRYLQPGDKLVIPYWVSFEENRKERELAENGM